MLDVSEGYWAPTITVSAIRCSHMRADLRERCSGGALVSTAFDRASASTCTPGFAGPFCTKCDNADEEAAHEQCYSCESHDAVQVTKSREPEGQLAADCIVLVLWSLALLIILTQPFCQVMVLDNIERGKRFSWQIVTRLRRWTRFEVILGFWHAINLGTIAVLVIGELEHAYGFHPPEEYRAFFRGIAIVQKIALGILVGPLAQCGAESRSHDLWVDPLPRLALLVLSLTHRSISAVCRSSSISCTAPLGTRASWRVST